MHRSARLAASLIVALVAWGCEDNPTAPSQPAQIAGTWTGTAESSNNGARAIQITLTQSGDSVTGTWTAGDWQGAVTATTDADSVSGTITIQIPTLLGTCTETSPFSGAASTESNAMNWMLVGFNGDCANPPTDARFVIQRR